MDKHHFRIAWLFIGFGVFNGLMALYILPKLSDMNNLHFGDSSFSSMFNAIIFLAAIIPFLSIVGGVLHYLKDGSSIPILSVVSVLLLFTFPIGTAIAVYYFWYKFFYIKSLVENTSVQQ